MRRVNIALVDDDETVLHVATGYIEVCLDEIGVKGTIAAFTDPHQFYDAFTRHYFDVVFLDIFMPGRNGMELAREIRTLSRKSQIVFLTVSSDYAVEGYDVQAANYLLKPVKKPLIEKVVRECIDRVEREEASFITLKNGAQLTQIRTSEVVYIEMRDRHVRVIGDTGEMFSRFGKLSDICPELPSAFVRVHQSYIVNAARIIGLKNYRVHMDTGAVLPVSRPYRQTAAQAFFSSIKKEL